jgi:hypothetical protein
LLVPAANGRQRVFSLQINTMYAMNRRLRFDKALSDMMLASMEKVCDF